MVAPASSRKCSLCSGTMRNKKPRPAATSRGPWGNRKPATKTETRNCSVPTLASRERQQRSRQRLEIRRHLAQHGTDVVVGLLPELVELRADDRPGFDLLRRRLKCEVAGAELARELPRPLDRTQPQP